MTGLRFRPAAPEDSEFAYQVKKASFGEYVEKVWGWDESEQRDLHTRRFQSQDVEIIELNGSDLGFIATVTTPEALRLYQMFILPEYQGRGIGSECVNRVVEKAKAFTIPVRLQVLKVNKRARAFYERLGFRTIGENDTHIKMEKMP